MGERGKGWNLFNALVNNSRFDLQLVSDDIEPGWRGGPVERPVASAANPVKGCVRRTLHWNLLRQGNESY